MSVVQPAGAREDVLATIAGMIASILGEEAADGADEADGVPDPGLEIGPETTLGADLMLESIDLVALSERLTDRYGEQVNVAELIAGMELDELIDLTVGRLVDHVLSGAPPVTER